MRCPLCNSPRQAGHPASNDLLVCEGCGECLWPDELVRRATRRTRRAYALANPESTVL